MPNPNEFFVQPANPLGGLQEAIGVGLRADAERRKGEAQQQSLQQAAALIRGGDPLAISDFMVANPELREHLIRTQAHTSAQTQAGRVQALKDILLGKPVEETMRRQIDLIQSQGGDATEAKAFLDPNLTDEQRKQKALAGLAIYDPQAAKSFAEVTKVERPDFQQGAGKMAGYNFDPSTGEFSIDPTLRAQLDANATELATKEALSAKDVSGVNDKVTALTKDVRAVYASAEALGGLQANASAASKLAAVFKFMKSLDPTSVVRETEQGQVYSAEGAASELAGMINSLLGEGKLTEEGFKDIVRTSKVLANAAVGTSGREVGDYLGVIRDNLSPKQFEALQGRVPEAFEIEEAAAALPPSNAQGWALMTDAQGNRAYVGPNNEIEEVQ